MKTWLAVCVVILGMTGSAWAGELIWSPNGEPDMSLYNVYMCKVKGCTATDAGPLWVGKVDHRAGVLSYSFPVPPNIEGAAVITAQDLAQNNSVPSNMVSFSTVPNLPPAAPLGLMFR